MNLSVYCQCSCNPQQSQREGGDEFYVEQHLDAGALTLPRQPRERRLVAYHADLARPLNDELLRHGELWHTCASDGKHLQQVRFLLHSNGYMLRPLQGVGLPTMVTWSPFSLVQACRLHTAEADEQMSWMRLFKISIFHYGVTHFFATQGEQADGERVRWVADIARAMRSLTQSLFPVFEVCWSPVPGAPWTAMRLLAGYLLMNEDRDVSLVYCELHAHWHGEAQFVAYEDDACDLHVVHTSVDKDTCVSERVGVDCSCFSIGAFHFAARSCAEKALWLRVVSNVKVKLRNGAADPTPTDLRHWRSSIAEHVRNLPVAANEDGVLRQPLLPRRVSGTVSTVRAERSTSFSGGVSKDSGATGIAATESNGVPVRALGEASPTSPASPPQQPRASPSTIKPKRPVPTIKGSSKAMGIAATATVAVERQPTAMLAVRLQQQQPGAVPVAACELADDVLPPSQPPAPVAAIAATPCDDAAGPRTICTIDTEGRASPSSP